ncbi:wax ester/triacylglycerol synthase domain-containing protein [Pseudofrankia sp. DC12]|uniref:wax ester/triacylglycerol synthase domain-containing protein n=1 Tax=Pseudofrankia sp. DC12 TaxID=683315 RepID=UPI001E4280D3|nr:wax ester/triacylglycerol synthase domain-containing protein [Pseudofrankia sp. DC12]
MCPRAADASPRPLSRMDRALLGYQRENRATPLSVAYLLRAEGRCSVGALRAAVLERSARFPLLAHRVTHPAGQASWPHWTPDPWFDVITHVREHHIPAGADESDVRALVARRCQTQIPLDAPPWELCLLHAPGTDEFYVLFRASHVWLDGTALHQVLTALFGAETAVGSAGWLRDGRVTPRTLAAAGGRLAGWMTPTASLEALARPVAGEHDLYWASTSVELLRTLGRAYGATVNDVFLVALGGAFEAWSRPVGGARRLKILMPVSARRPEESNHLSNFVVGTRVGLPCGLGSPSRRFGVVRRQTARYRSGTAAGAGERWWFERVPTRFGRVAVAMGMDPRRVAVSTSNLGVMAAPLTIAGSPVTEAVPVPVPVPGQRMFVILGGVGPKASLGVAIDRNVPRGATLANLWLAELDALTRAASTSSGFSHTFRPRSRRQPQRTG